MKNITKALLIGICAGIADVVPMIAQNIPPTACISAFAQWVALGLIIPYVTWRMPAWLRGMCVALLAAVPVVIIVSDNEPVSAVPILVFSAVLGSAVGLAGAKFITHRSTGPQPAEH